MTDFLLSAEQMIAYQRFLNVTLATQQAVGVNRPFYDFMNNIMLVKPALSDEQRTINTTLYEHGGSVGKVNANGEVLGEDYNTDIVATPNIITKEEYAAPFSVAERNIGKLMLVIDSLVQKRDMKEATRIFVDEGFMDRFKKVAINDIYSLLESQTVTIIEGGTSATIYGDTVFATSGTKFNHSNLLAGALDSAMMDSLYNNLHTHVNERGVRYGYTQPKYVFTKASNLATVKKLFYPAETENMQYGQIFNGENGRNSYPFDAVDFTSNITFVGTDDPGLAIEVDYKIPRVIVNKDDKGNAKVLVKMIWGIGWKHREGMVLLNHA